MRATLRQPQNAIVATIWLTYAFFYLGRVNLSVVLPQLAEALQISRAEVGALGTIFFWVYGIGHFVSGEIGSHVSPFRMISGGLLLIALINIAFSFQTSLLMMLLLWGMNGVAQSGGWSPMFRILAERLEPARIKAVSTLMPFSFVIGTAVTWTLVGALAGAGDWRIAFRLPGIVILVVLVFWRKAGVDAPKSRSRGFSLAKIVGEVRAFSFALAAAALVGFAFNGAIIWLPSYIRDTGLTSDHLAGFVAALMQVIAIIGLLLTRFLVARSDRAFPIAAIMFLVPGLAFLLMTATEGILALLIVTLGLVALNGGFGLMVGAVPLLLAPPGRASSITGSVNMMSNVFGGMAGVSIGWLVEQSGWTAAFALWGGLLLLASAIIWRRRDMEFINKRA